jgi:hypothetical protein
VKFDDGAGNVLDVNLASDIGSISADQAVNGALDGTTLAASYQFASYEVGNSISTVKGGATLADTAVISFAGITELAMAKDDTGATPVWRFNSGASEVFNITQVGENFALDYTSNGAGADVSLSGIEYAMITNDLDYSLLKLSFISTEPVVFL